MCKNCGNPYIFWHGLGDLFARESEDTKSHVSNEILDGDSFFFLHVQPDEYQHIRMLGVDKASHTRYFPHSFDNLLYQPPAQAPYDEPSPTMDQLINSLTESAMVLYKKLTQYDSSPDW